MTSKKNKRDPYEIACATGAKRKAEVLEEIKKCPVKYVSYGDGDLGMAVPRDEAITDIESMDPITIGAGTWYPCDRTGKELTATQLAAATLGSSRSEAKVKASRENGKKGGRPVENTTKIENVRKAIVNGQQVKLFDVRKYHDGGWFFYATFKAPARTANKDLTQYIE